MNIPLFFSLVRIVASPLLLAPLLAGQASAILVVPLYSFLALTDFCDGFFARRYNMVTAQGAFLDQFADKVFLFSVLIPLVFLHRCSWWWALLIIMREVFVMGLREYALQQGKGVPVSVAAKYKTALQMLLFGVLLVPALYEHLCITVPLFVAMICASYYSAYGYCTLIRIS